MSVEQVASAILKLTPQERRRLATWFDEYRHEFIEDSSNEEVEGAQEAEVLLRLREMDANPQDLEAMEDPDLEKLTQEFIHARAKKTSARQS
jgi:hypothetical protein